MKNVAIHLVTWNGEAYISQLFESLVAQTYKNFCVYVWDNASKDHTVEALSKYRGHIDIEIIESDVNMYFAEGHNQLFVKTKSDFILVLNQDAYLEPTCIETLVGTLEEDPSRGVVAPRVMQFDKRTIDSLGLRVCRNRRIVELYQGEQWEDVQTHISPDVMPVFGVSAAVALYRRAALEHVAFAQDEFFDRLYTMYKEDVDLAYRLQSAGWNAAVVPDAVAYHDRSTSGSNKMGDIAASKNKIKQSDVARYHSYKNHIITLLKNLYWQNYLQDALWLEWYESKKFVWMLLFDRKTAAGLREIWDMRKEILKKRKLIRAKRTRSAAAMRTQIYL